MSYLSDFEELNGGYVAFGGNPKGGKITGKGKIKTGNLVRGLPTKVFKNDNSCVACKKGKQHRASCKSKPVSSVDEPLFRLHMDLFGLTFVKSLSRRSYCLVITDDYSRFTWVFFLATKVETSPILKTFITGLENQFSLKVKVILSDNGTEFKNFDLNQFCGFKGIKREFSVPRTPQQNGIAERKNRTLIEAAKTMLADSLIPIPFWAEAVNTACYVQNRVLVTKTYNKTLYELLHGRKPSIGFMRPFGCPVIILNTLDYLGKFQENVDEGFLVGYSVCIKAFRVFNSRTRIVQKTLHVNFLENKPNVAGTGPTWLFDIDSLSGTMNYHPVSVENQANFNAGFQDTFDGEKEGEEVTQTYALFPVWSAGSTNPQNNDKDALVDGKEHDVDIQKSVSAVIYSSSSSAQTRKQADKTERENKGKSPVESFTGYRDLNAEFEGCSNNSSNGVNAASSTVPTVGHNFINITNTFSAAGPSNTTVSPTYGKSSFTNASTSSHDPDMPALEELTYSDNEAAVGAEADINNLESSIPVSLIPTTRIHKDHPISQIIGDLSSTTQTRNEEGINYEEVFAPVTRIEVIRLFLAYAPFMGFLVYQMDVKSAFLYGTIEEEVYVCQPLGFEDPDHLNKVYKVVKELYGLHQALKAWYETLATYLLENSFQRGTIDQTLFIKKQKGDILLVQIYVDDIIFGATNKALCKSFENLMKDRFQMSYMEELTFFLGLQAKQKKDGIFISQDKYVDEILRKFRLTKGKSASTPIDAEKTLLKAPDGEDCKKQTVVATSSIDAEYVAAASGYAQVPWIQNQLLDYGVFNSPMLYLLRVEMVLNSPCPYWVSKNWLVQKQTALGKDILNPLMADNLSKIIWYSTHHITLMKSWLVQKQTALGKDILNPLMADNLSKIIWYSTHHITLMKSWLVQKQTALGKDSLNPLTVDSLLKTIWFSIHHHLTNEVLAIPGQTATGKKVVISKAIIRDVLRLDDAEGVDCLPNEEIFTGLARMGYEKPSTKLTFYKAFFSSQWKFLIHTILQSLSAKRTSWNEFSSAMASAVICLSTGRKFNFSKYIFESLVRNVDSSSKFYMYPRFVQLIIQNQLGDLSTHTTKYSSPALTQKVFANMRRVGKGFSRVEIPLSEGMLVVREIVKDDIGEEQVLDATAVTTAAQEVVPAAVLEDVHDDSIPSPAPPTPSPQPSQDIPSISQAQSPPQQPQSSTPSQPQGATFPMSLLQEALDAYDIEDVSNQGRMIIELDRDEGIELMGEQAKDVVDDAQVEGRQAEKQAKIYQIDLDHPSKVLSMQDDDPEVQEAVEVVTTAKLITEVVTAASTSVSTASIIIPTAEPNVPAAAPTVVPAKEDKTVQRYQVIKKRPQTEVQARKNMITYLKNTAGFRLDYFKGLSYNDIRLIFEAKFNTNMEFLLKLKEQMEEEEERAIESINETPAQKAAKRMKLNEEAKEVEDLKQHLEIVLDEDDDVYTEATPLARMVPVVDYQIIQLNNKPRYKIIKADETHQLYASFITVLKNFDREDLETLWSIVKERSLKKNTKCFNAVGEKLSAVKHKLMLLDTAAEGRVNTAK
nr:putative ribonuclease H-like domain-containing protein [Tanacetum cinerariifolium]